MKKKIIVLIVSLLLICLITFSARLIPGDIVFALRFALIVLLNLLNGAVALVAIKITGIKIGIELANWKSYLIGLGVALVLSFFIAFLPALLGFSLVGRHVDFTWAYFFLNLFFYMIIVGPVEELIFRVYVQETFIGFFTKHKWIGVIIASALFGLWHFINNGDFAQVLFTFGIGLAFGFAKYFIKECKYVGVAFAHGLYDFLNVIVQFFVV